MAPLLILVPTSKRQGALGPVPALQGLSPLLGVWGLSAPDPVHRDLPS